MSKKDLIDIYNDKSFEGDFKEKMKYYCEKNIHVASNHPMTLIYACVTSDKVEDCINLLTQLSVTNNFSIIPPDTFSILNFVKEVMALPLEDVGIKRIEQIYDIEERYLITITSVPLIFFKVCNEGSSFNKDNLKKMLDLREKVKRSELSQYDASVDIGTELVDKYIKKK
jgi:hypothetical protein